MDVTATFGGLISVEVYSAQLSCVDEFLRGLGSFVTSNLDAVPSENGEWHHVIRLIGTAFLSAASQLTSITAKQNCANEQAIDNDQLPPVMPYKLATYMRPQFCAVVSKHILRLQQANFTQQRIESVGEEHGMLPRAFHVDENLCIVIDDCNHRN